MAGARAPLQRRGDTGRSRLHPAIRGHCPELPDSGDSHHGGAVLPLIRPSLASMCSIIGIEIGFLACPSLLAPFLQHRIQAHTDTRLSWDDAKEEEAMSDSVGDNLDGNLDETRHRDKPVRGRCHRRRAEASRETDQTRRRARPRGRGVTPWARLPTSGQSQRLVERHLIAQSGKG
jgi:hypothetical protein